ncbi:uncharacterized protein LOC125239390 [Leguminivora glycinivorella]|uniref:uncharacterized protein LOC125239390 n=1 Tax=Leguminivora glycinivorella TaxID=1035111 RepID=UPI0020106E61|nr:uncharacterized protein LOC125239390 [Leguminivora glycinivorella]
MHTATIPPSTDALGTPSALDSEDRTRNPAHRKDSALDGTLDGTLDGRQGEAEARSDVKHTVLESVKKLLGSQLAAIKNGEIGDDDTPKKRPSKVKSKLHLISNQKHKTSRKDEIAEDGSSDEDLGKPEIIKVLTDESNQDLGDEALREAVDELLEENGNEIILAENTLDLENIQTNNNEEKLGKVAKSIIRNDKKDRKGNDIDQRKNIVILEPLRKLNRNDDEDDVVLNAKYKSIFKDSDESLSLEVLEEANDRESISENPETKQLSNMFLRRRSRFPKQKTYIAKKSKNVDNLKASDRSKVDRVRPLNVDEKMLKPETLGSRRGNNGKTNTFIDLDGFDFKKKPFQINLRQSENYEDLVDSSEESNEDIFGDLLYPSTKEVIENMNKNNNRNLKPIYQKGKPAQVGKPRNNYWPINQDRLVNDYDGKYKTYAQKETPLKLIKLSKKVQKPTVRYVSPTSEENSNSYEESKDTTDVDANIFDEDGRVTKFNVKNEFQVQDSLVNNKRTGKLRSDDKKENKRIVNALSRDGEYINERSKPSDESSRAKTRQTIRITKDKVRCSENDDESDESKILRDLMQNKELKKSFTFSLNFTTQ